MDPVNAAFDYRALAGFTDRLLNFLFGLADHFLDTARMDAAVRDEALETDARDLAPDWVVTGDNHRLGRVIDDDVDAGGRLDRADIAALEANDATLHLVVGERDHRNGALGDEFAGEALDGDRDDSLGAAVSLLTSLFFDDTDMLGSFGARLPEHLVHQRALGLLAGEAGDLFEAAARLFDKLILLLFLVGEIF